MLMAIHQKYWRETEVMQIWLCYFRKRDYRVSLESCDSVVIGSEYGGTVAASQMTLARRTDEAIGLARKEVYRIDGVRARATRSSRSF
jgi:hypothetical protein